MARTAKDKSMKPSPSSKQKEISYETYLSKQADFISEAVYAGFTEEQAKFLFARFYPLQEHLALTENI